MKTKVVHSESKLAWNVVGTQCGRKYKIARVPCGIKMRHLNTLYLYQNALMNCIGINNKMFEFVDETYEDYGYYTQSKTLSDNNTIVIEFIECEAKKQYIMRLP